jgi:predicted O-methyltransferase YrrM
MNLQGLLNELNQNSEFYENLKKQVEMNITGRICHHEVVILSVLVNLFDIKNYVEIGVHNGASMSYVVGSRKQVSCFGIDLFENTVKQYKRDDLKISRTKENILKNNKNQSTVTLIQGDSKKNGTIIKLQESLGGKKIDLLFIDGDHSYEGVKEDFLNYTPFAKEGGIIVLDDCNQKWPGVLKFSMEIDEEKFEKVGNFGKGRLILRKINLL